MSVRNVEQSQFASPVEQAHEMAGWLGPYLEHQTDVVGTIPPLALARCLGITGKPTLEDHHMGAIRTNLERLDIKARDNASLYVCGLPDADLDVYATAKNSRMSHVGRLRKYVQESLVGITGYKPKTETANPAPTPVRPQVKSEWGKFVVRAQMAKDLQAAFAVKHDRGPKEGSLEWQELALCSQTDPDTHFPEHGIPSSEAKKYAYLVP